MKYIFNESQNSCVHVMIDYRDLACLSCLTYASCVLCMLAEVRLSEALAVTVALHRTVQLLWYVCL